MGSLRCCGFGRSLSPEPEPIRLLDSSQRGGRFALSSHSVSSARSAHSRPIQEIFASASKDEGSNGTPTVSAHDLPSRREMRSRSDVHQKESSYLLQGVASKVRKRMSHESGISRRSSKRNLKSSLSIEHIKRRNELKGALSQRVNGEILEDLAGSDNSYDEDAILLKTPSTTWGRHEGLVQISQMNSSKVLKMSNSPPHSSYTELNQGDLSHVFAQKGAALSLSRMLTQRASHQPGDSEAHTANVISGCRKRTKSTKKFVFGEDTPTKTSPTRTPSPLTRANTVIRLTPSNKPIERAFNNPTFLVPTGAPSSPHLLPTRLESISDSLAEGDWRLSFSERSKGVLPELNGLRKLAVGVPSPSIYDTNIQPNSEQWLHGASGLMGPTTQKRHVAREHYANDSKETHHCDPRNEEMGFRGIDGEDDSPPESAYTNARTRVQSEGGESGHLYNLHVPRRLASKSLLPSVSLPQLQKPNQKLGDTSEESTQSFATKPRRQASTSEIITSKTVPMAWDNPGRRATSSVYSSQPESLLSSRRNSALRVTSLQDREKEFKDHFPKRGIISVYPEKIKIVDLERLERRTGSTSFHSSNESLTNKEINAAERRIPVMPRANTLPKNSRFREDLEQISAELALTNPPRRRFSDFDGSGGRRSPSRSSGKEEATSVWEKVLREHSLEDRALMHTRLGSYSPDFSGPTDVGPRNEIPSRRPSSLPSLSRNQDHLSVRSGQFEIQAHLAAYKLSTHIQTPKDRPLLDKSKRAVSVYPISSWARYPSHSRPERSSSPAGPADQVFIRDFATMTPNNTPVSSPSHLNKGRNTKNMSFGKQMMSSLTRLYKSQSQELQRRLANEARGHRSSVSQGGVLEYPELEMLGSISPPLPSLDVGTKNGLAESLESVALERVLAHGSAVQLDEAEAAKRWSTLYQDCIVPLSTSVSSSPPASTRSMKVSEEVGLIDGLATNTKDGRSHKAEEPGSGSSNLRASTLDFKRSLEEHEGLARERALGLVERMSA